MLYKLMGGGMIITATTIAGFLKARTLANRVDSLIRIKTALSVLESEISFSANSLKLAFLRIERTVDTGGMFAEAGEAIAGCGVEQAWKQAVDNSRRRLSLTEHDAELLKTLAAELGMTDRENQIKNIRRVSALLDAASVQAQAEYTQTARLYRSGGILTGLLFIILLF